MGKPGEAKGIEGEWVAGWENGREGDREEEKQQMRFKRNDTRAEKKERFKNKGVVFFSPLRISGTDIWIKPGMWRD